MGWIVARLHQQTVDGPPVNILQPWIATAKPTLDWITAPPMWDYMVRKKDTPTVNRVSSINRFEAFTRAVVGRSVLVLQCVDGKRWFVKFHLTVC